MRMRRCEGRGWHAELLCPSLCLRSLLKDVSHVILDEVHERNIISDFLTIIMRDLLPSRSGYLSSLTQYIPVYSLCIPMLHIGLI